MRPSRELVEFLFVLSMFAIALLIIMLFNVRVGNAHPQMLLQCQKYIQHNKAVLIQEGLLPNGLYSEAYDTNDDGKIDVEAISIVQYVDTSEGQPLYRHEEYPMYYAVDLDYNHWPDVIIQDIKRQGNCEDLRTMIDGSTAGGKQRMQWFLEIINSPGEKPYKGVQRGA